VHTPIISANDCEGAGELFMISSKEVVPEAAQPAAPKPTGPWNDFFGVPEAYLTVSGQLQAEIFATSMGKVYTFGPTFRAENSNTPRHLAEFWMIEPEIAFCDLDGVIDVSERFIKSVIADVLANSKEDLDFFAKWTDTTLLDRLKDTMEKPFVRVTYTDAVELLNKAKYVRLAVLS
jgi:asparaginyl-tRNA synthetase